MDRGEDVEMEMNFGGEGNITAIAGYAPCAELEWDWLKENLYHKMKRYSVEDYSLKEVVEYAFKDLEWENRVKVSTEEKSITVSIEFEDIINRSYANNLLLKRLCEEMDKNNKTTLYDISISCYGISPDNPAYTAKILAIFED